MLRLRSALAVPALLLLACGGGPNRPDFTFLQSPPTSAATFQVHLTHDPEGQPWIAYSDTGVVQTRVARWTGALWEEKGQPTPTQTGVPPALAGQIAFGANGQLFLGERLSSFGEVRVRTWDGTQWKDVATFFGNVSGDLMAWDLRVDLAARPIISSAGMGDVEVRIWKDGAWTAIGPGELTSNIPNPSGGMVTLHDPSLELDAQGHPVVAHLEGNFTQTRLWVQRWTGTQWQFLGAPAFSESQFLQAARPDLALDAQGTPYVVWADVETGAPTQRGRAHVSRWTGLAWEPLGGPITLPDAATPVRSPTLRIDSQGRPVLSFEQGTSYGDIRIHLRRWNGTSWDVLGQPLTGAEPDALNTHAMAIGPDDVPVLAWSQRIGKSVFTSGRTVLYVARHNEGH